MAGRHGILRGGLMFNQNGTCIEALAVCLSGVWSAVAEFAAWITTCTAIRIPSTLLVVKAYGLPDLQAAFDLLRSINTTPARITPHASHSPPVTVSPPSVTPNASAITGLTKA